MGSKQKLLFVFLLLFFGMHLSISPVLAQEKTQPNSQPQKSVKPPIDIQFTNQMSRSKKDMDWSKTYHDSYQRTKEIPYLQLAAQFCLKAVNRLADAQKMIPRTTKFYNMADEKRLYACQFYTKLQRMSFLLEPKNHIRGSGDACK